ncbi:MAG: hypothetical protein H6626_12870 [Pseudobdellovibrionaceae bacterium]|nr:MAG: hypothetical protein H6626_12870 [Pseudobdellovibrionaceae bacterium]
MSNSLPTPENFKEKAKLIRTFMKNKCDASISHSHSLELISQLFGFKDWNTATAVSKSRGRLPTNIKTVGQMKRVLEKFDDSAELVMWNLHAVAGLIDVIKELNLTDETFQDEYSLVFDGVAADKASFQLKLEDEKLISADGKEIDPFRNPAICDL